MFSFVYVFELYFSLSIVQRIRVLFIKISLNRDVLFIHKNVCEHVKQAYKTIILGRHSKIKLISKIFYAQVLKQIIVFQVVILKKKIYIFVMYFYIYIFVVTKKITIFLVTPFQKITTAE